VKDDFAQRSAAIRACCRAVWVCQSASTARVATRVALFASVTVGAANAIIVYTTRDSLPQLFDKDSAVRKVATGAMPALALYQTFDAFNAVAGGVMRGAGRQTTPAVIMLLAYYLFGIPGAVVLAFTAADLRLVGLWLGLTFGLTTATAMFAVNLTCIVDWPALAKEAVQRTDDQARASASLDDPSRKKQPLLSQDDASSFADLDDDLEDSPFPRVDNYQPIVVDTADEQKDGALVGRKKKRSSQRPSVIEQQDDVLSTSSAGLSLKEPLLHPPARVGPDDSQLA